MAGAPINTEILHIWEIKDAAGAAITGLQPTMTAALSRFPDSATRVAASETVTIAEIGTTGFYAITYTPTLAQTYKCRITESTQFLEYTFEDDVVDAPAAVTSADAYCTEADVVAWAQMGDYTTTTTPTEAQVLLFMQSRAAELYSILSRIMGSSTPGPSSFDVDLDETTDKGKGLGRLLRMANAIGAAMDAVEASGAGQGPARSERVSELGTMYSSLVRSLLDAARNYLGNATRSQTHISGGEMTRRTVTAVAESLAFDESTKW